MQQSSNKTRHDQSPSVLAQHVFRLTRQRMVLEEEVLQLRAAAHIWAEVCHNYMARSQAGQGDNAVRLTAPE